MPSFLHTCTPNTEGGERVQKERRGREVRRRGGVDRQKEGRGREDLMQLGPRWERCTPCAVGDERDQGHAGETKEIRGSREIRSRRERSVGDERDRGHETREIRVTPAPRCAARLTRRERSVGAVARPAPVVEKEKDHRREREASVA